MSEVLASELARARARIAALELEIARISEDAQREADAMFAQYQLSQLLSSGASATELAEALCVELIRLTSAGAVLLWTTAGGRGEISLLGRAGAAPADAPERLGRLEDGMAWASGMGGAVVVPLDAGDQSGLVALVPATGQDLDPEGVRVVRLVRHELAVALRDAGLRLALDVERRELNAIVEGATDAILQVDQETRVLRANDAALRLLGRTSEATLGRTCGEVLGCARAGGHAESACPLVEALSVGVPIPNRETAVIGADGRVVEMVGGYARTAGGDRPPRAIAILRDVSGARALQELREGFVATVSHELRTPLALIKGYAETILHLDPPPDEQRRYVERINQLGDRLRTLVTGILDVAHLQADPLLLERSPVRLEALSSRLATDLEVAGEGGRLVLDFPADLPPVEVDPVRIGQVLENLVDNARKYAPPGSPIVIRAEATEPGMVAVQVLDEGVGVPGADRSLVFEPFHRGRNVRESHIPGTGLGLAISRRIVEAHGGRLVLGDRADGGPGMVATFTVPAVRARRRPAVATAVEGGGSRVDRTADG